jgi:adenosylcobinamide amidohydrolase
LKQIENADSHSKLGELIAKAVNAGVQEAVYKPPIF